MNSKHISSHENESHHTLTPILLHIINISKLTGQWQHFLGGDAAPR